MNGVFVSSALAVISAGCVHAGPQHATGLESSTSVVDPAAPALSIQRFVPVGKAVHAVHAGDLDGDGDEDRLVILESTGADAAAAPRGVLLLTRDKTGGWHAAARNDRAIPCAECGGAMGGDPLIAVEAGTGGFALQFEGGSRELWSATYRFHYDAATSAWGLTAVERKVLDRITGASRQARADASKFGRVNFADFDPADTDIAPVE